MDREKEKRKLKRQDFMRSLCFLSPSLIGVGVFFLLKNIGGKSKGSEKRASQYYDDYDDAGDDGAGDDGGDYDDRRGNYRK